MNEHKCSICKDVGWVREDKKVCDDDFGRLQPCECNQDAIDYLKNLEPAPVPVPEPSEAQLRWIDYTE